MVINVMEAIACGSRNPVEMLDLVDGTGDGSIRDKEWTKQYPPIGRINVQSTIHLAGFVTSGFSACLDKYEDDDRRLAEPAQYPNYKRWRLHSKQDGSDWFNAEVSNIVLAAWARYPALTQVAHEKPLTEGRQPDTETVDIAYSVKHNRRRMHVAIGQIKTREINPMEWQNGDLSEKQRVLSQELRAYAVRYECPHVFCFDQNILLMLQFRASSVVDINNPDCEVDCWVIPRTNPAPGVTLGYALYRLLLQGYRRCQGEWLSGSSPCGIPPHRREYFNGQPVWLVDGQLTAEPNGHRRKIDPAYGSFYWTNTDGMTPLRYPDNIPMEDTSAVWRPESEFHSEIEALEDYQVTRQTQVGSIHIGKMKQGYYE